LLAHRIRKWYQQSPSVVRHSFTRLSADLAMVADQSAWTVERLRSAIPRSLSRARLVAGSSDSPGDALLPAGTQLSSDTSSTMISVVSGATESERADSSPPGPDGRAESPTGASTVIDPGSTVTDPGAPIGHLPPHRPDDGDDEAAAMPTPP